MVSVNNLTISFSGRYLFDDVSFNINNQDRIGLIGRNGAGKTTMLRILTGLDIAESGTVNVPKDFKIGYLPQEGVINSDLSIYEETRRALSEILYLEDEINHFSNELSRRNDYNSESYSMLIEKMNHAGERLRILGGSSIDAEIDRVLTGLGFNEDDFSRNVKEFSGGWQMRIELAKLLLQKTDLLLLDEPTNHLDIDSIQWLEQYLKSYFGTIIIVSHDRNFLDNITIRTVEISLGKIHDLPLKYTDFLEARVEQRELQMSAYNNQQKQIRQTEKFIERFRYKATLASRVQSRIKQLEKVDRLEIEETDNSALDIRFPETPRSGILVAEAIGLSKSYGSINVLTNIDLAVERGERIAFVGRNGEGKTTLSKIFAGIETFDGTLTIGHNVRLGYYAQHQAELLSPDDTVYDVIERAATGEMRAKIRSLLGAFLFSGDSVYKKIKVLSGGEKSRLALAKLLLEPVNFLILDEPTNHLDIVSKEILKKALINFSGAIIIVSHDRDFLDGLTQKTIYFKNQKIKEYLGGIFEFLGKHEIESLNEIEINNEKNPQLEIPEKKDKMIRSINKQKQKEVNIINKKIQNIETEIAGIENEIKQIEKLFLNSDFYNNHEESNKISDKYTSLKTKLETLLNDWTLLSEELENS